MSLLRNTAITAACIAIVTTPYMVFKGIEAATYNINTGGDSITGHVYSVEETRPLIIRSVFNDSCVRRTVQIDSVTGNTSNSITLGLDPNDDTTFNLLKQAQQNGDIVRVESDRFFNSPPLRCARSINTQVTNVQIVSSPSAPAVGG